MKQPLYIPANFDGECSWALALLTLAMLTLGFAMLAVLALSKVAPTLDLHKDGLVIAT